MKTPFEVQEKFRSEVVPGAHTMQTELPIEIGRDVAQVAEWGCL